MKWDDTTRLPISPCLSLALATSLLLWTVIFRVVLGA